jgi:hypothetical protein
MTVSFEGERGSGAGVSREFYSLVAQELCNLCPASSAPAAAPLPLFYSDTDDAAEYALHSRGLFPRVLPCGCSDSERASYRLRFELLGRLIAKGLQEKRHVPLPLSTSFFATLQRRVRFAPSTLSLNRYDPFDLFLYSTQLRSLR